MLTAPAFAEPAMKSVLLKDTEDRCFTLDEYRKLVEAQQTDKNGDIIYLYATDPTAQYTYIKGATDRGYDVLLMDGQLDSHFIGLMEQKLEKTRFVRVDSDVIDNLILKEDKRNVTLSDTQRSVLTTVFSSQIPTVEKTNFLVSFEALGETSMPVVITQNEFMRRMKDMAALQPGMNFYGELPDSFNLVVNTDSPLVARVTEAADKSVAGKVQPLMDKVNADNAQITTLRGDGKTAPDTETQQKISDLEKAVADTRAEQEKLVKDFAQGQPLVKQMIDLALLGNGLLRGKNLNDFITRSVTLLK